MVLADSRELSMTLPAKLGAMAALVGDFLQQTAFDKQPILDRLTGQAVDTIPSAQYCGITVIGAKTEVSTAAAVGRYPVVLDEISRSLGEGPCLSAAHRGLDIRVDDLAADDRWPRFRSAALTQTPIRSVLSFRLFAERCSAGVLTFYAEGADAFDDESLETGSVVAAHTTLAWALLRRQEEFRAALASRDLIGQAKGVIMERFSVDAARAFQMLERLSQDTNTKLIDLAQRLMDTQHFSPNS